MCFFTHYRQKECQHSSTKNRLLEESLSTLWHCPHLVTFFYISNMWILDYLFYVIFCDIFNDGWFVFTDGWLVFTDDWVPFTLDRLNFAWMNYLET
jgi:hypothetical protein